VARGVAVGVAVSDAYRNDCHVVHDDFQRATTMIGANSDHLRLTTLTASPVAPDTGPPASASVSAMAAANGIDGTPLRVVILGLGAAGVLLAFRLSGLKFNIGVSA